MEPPKSVLTDAAARTRIADAATALIDASIEAAPAHIATEGGASAFSAALGMAVQALFTADMMNPDDPSPMQLRTMSTDDIAHRAGSIGAGIGQCMAMIQAPHGQAEFIDALTDGIGFGFRHRQATNAGMGG